MGVNNNRGVSLSSCGLFCNQKDQNESSVKSSHPKGKLYLDGSRRDLSNDRSLQTKDPIYLHQGERVPKTMVDHFYDDNSTRMKFGSQNRREANEKVSRHRNEQETEQQTGTKSLMPQFEGSQANLVQSQFFYSRSSRAIVLPTDNIIQTEARQSKHSISRSSSMRTPLDPSSEFHLQHNRRILKSMSADPSAYRGPFSTQTESRQSKPRNSRSPSMRASFDSLDKVHPQQSPRMLPSPWPSVSRSSSMRGSLNSSDNVHSRHSPRLSKSPSNCSVRSVQTEPRQSRPSVSKSSSMRGSFNLNLPDEVHSRHISGLSKSPSDCSVHSVQTEPGQSRPSISKSSPMRDSLRLLDEFHSQQSLRMSKSPSAYRALYSTQTESRQGGPTISESSLVRNLHDQFQTHPQQSPRQLRSPFPSVSRSSSMRSSFFPSDEDHSRQSPRPVESPSNCSVHSVQTEPCQSKYGTSRSLSRRGLPDQFHPKQSPWVSSDCSVHSTHTEPCKGKQRPRVSKNNSDYRKLYSIQTEPDECNSSIISSPSIIESFDSIDEFHPQQSPRLSRNPSDCSVHSVQSEPHQSKPSISRLASMRGPLDQFQPQQSPRVSKSTSADPRGDNDTWMELMIVNCRKDKQEKTTRSLFYSMGTGIAFWDEPPSGASTVMFSSDSTAMLIFPKKQKMNEDSEVWIEIFVQRRNKTKSGNSRTLFYSTKTHKARWDYPPTGPNNVIFFQKKGESLFSEQSKTSP